MSSNQGGIPRWVSGLSVAAIVATLAVVVPIQVYAHKQLQTPQNLCVCARPSPTAVKLTWNDPGLLTQDYVIQRSTVSDFSSNTIEIKISKNTYSYVDETQAFGATFFYRIAAEAFVDRSAFSAPLAARNGTGTRPKAPAVAANVNLTSVGDGLLITWSDRATNETGYWIERSGDDGVTWEFRASLGPNTQSYDDTDAPLTAPMYRVWTFNSGGTATSYIVQWLNPRVAVPSVVPSNLASQATALASGVASAVPTNVASLVPTNLTSLVPTNLTSATSIATVVPTNLATATAIASVTQVASVVPSNPATLVPTVTVPDVDKIKIWFGLFSWNPSTGKPLGPIQTVWILPASCLGNGCRDPKVPTNCAPLPFLGTVAYCYYIATF